jgi:hypothetical protein
MRRLFFSRGLCLVFGLGLAPGSVRAEDPPAPGTPTATATPAPDPVPGQPRNRRLLNGHDFLPSAVSAPLAVSSFGLEAGFAVGSATGPSFDINGNPIGENRTYSWGGLGQAIRFQTVFFDQLVLRGAITTSLASGIDGWSALVVGTTVQGGLGLGLEWSTPVGQSLRLGVSVDADSAPQLNLLVAAAIIHAIKTGRTDPAGALEIGNAVTVLPALSVAWAPTPAFGLAARAGYTWASVDAGAYGSFSRQAVALGVAADASLDKLWKVPMGIGLTYSETIPTDGTPAGIRNVGLAVMYTGKQDVVVGATLGERVLDIRPQYDVPLKSSSGYLDVVLQIFWP